MKSGRGGTSEQGRSRREQGHQNATAFANAIGLGKEYQRDRRAKKDVIDPAGDSHSVKSGEKKWQIFLYGRKRFVSDDGFQALNGVGSLLVHCLDVFPPRYEDYINNKEEAKLRLQVPMRELRDRFQRKALLRAFLRKSIFNGGEVSYLTIRYNRVFRVYWSDDVVKTLASMFTVSNSSGISHGQFDDQKVVFRWDDRNVGELEMRTSGPEKYVKVLFNINARACIDLLDSADLSSISWKHNQNVMLYGKARETFGHW